MTGSVEPFCFVQRNMMSTNHRTDVRLSQTSADFGPGFGPALARMPSGYPKLPMEELNVESYRGEDQG